MRYVDGYVLTIKKKDLDTYRKMARGAGKVWMKHGALEYVECAADDLSSVNEWGGLPFPKMTKAKPDETVIFAFVIYKSKAHRDRVNKKVTEQMEIDKEKYKDVPMPFKLKDMAYGGFETIVDLMKKD